MTIIHAECRTYSMGTSTKLITVASFETAPEAWVYQNKLEANGIRAFVADEHVVNAKWSCSLAIGGVKVQITDQEIATFKQFTTLEATTSPAEFPCFEKDTPGEFGICPHCQSSELSFQRWAKRKFFLLWLLLGWAIPVHTPSLKCNCCGAVLSEPIGFLRQFKIAMLLITTIFAAAMFCSLQ